MKEYKVFTDTDVCFTKVGTYIHTIHNLSDELINLLNTYSNEEIKIKSSDIAISRGLLVLNYTYNKQSNSIKVVIKNSNPYSTSIKSTEYLFSIYV